MKELKSSLPAFEEDEHPPLATSALAHRSLDRFRLFNLRLNCFEGGAVEKALSLQLELELVEYRVSNYNVQRYLFIFVVARENAQDTLKNVSRVRVPVLSVEQGNIGQPAGGVFVLFGESEVGKVELLLPLPNERNDLSRLGQETSHFGGIHLPDAAAEFPDALGKVLVLVDGRRAADRRD